MMNIYKLTLSYSSSFCSQMFLGSSWDLGLWFQKAFLVFGFVPCCQGERGTASMGCCSGGRCSAPTTIRVQETFPAEGK